jgi:hypothetical protein
MAITLYDATAGYFIQTMGALEHLLKRGQAHCTAHNLDVGRIVEARIREDMLPFRYQVEAAIGHSLGAIEGAKTGEFLPPKGTRDADYPALQKQVADARTKLQAFTPDEINALEGKDVVFNLAPDRKLPFEGHDFLMSFSVPNFYFHATTAYDILRAIGVPLGKQDFLGRIRMKK